MQANTVRASQSAPLRRHQLFALAAVCLIATVAPFALFTSPASAQHEGHDHDVEHIESPDSQDSHEGHDHVESPDPADTHESHDTTEQIPTNPGTSPDGFQQVPTGAERIIGSPDPGPDPLHSGDRGGSLQLMTMGTVAAAVAFIMWRITRAARRAARFRNTSAAQSGAPSATES